MEDAGVIDEAVKCNPTFIEIRLDRMAGDLLDQVRAIGRRPQSP